MNGGRRKELLNMFIKEREVRREERKVGDGGVRGGMREIMNCSVFFWRKRGRRRRRRRRRRRSSFSGVVFLIVKTLILLCFRESERGQMRRKR
jgi:hypothetical protein